MKSRVLTQDEICKLYKDEYGIIFMLLFECALRYSELKQLEIADLRREHVVYIKSSKHGNAKTITISKALKKQLNLIDNKQFYQLRNVTCQCLNKRMKLILKQNIGISTHAFRKTLGNTLYTQTKDPLFVQQWLGHKNLGSTQYYLQSNYELNIKDLHDYHFNKETKTEK